MYGKESVGKSDNLKKEHNIDPYMKTIPKKSWFLQAL